MNNANILTLLNFNILSDAKTDKLLFLVMIAFFVNLYYHALYLQNSQRKRFLNLAKS
jgi:hypothetical protein